MSQAEVNEFPMAGGFALIDAIHARRGLDTGEDYVSRARRRAMRETRAYLMAHYTITHVPPPPAPRTVIRL